MKLRFYARGTALVMNQAAADAGRKQFVGRRLDPLAGEVFTDFEGKLQRQAVFAPMTTPDEVDFDAHYVRAALDGDLEPADQATAAACGIAWPLPKHDEEAG